MLLLGLDIGSSSIKAALVDARTGITLGSVHAPETEMAIHATQPGWAEQDPESWWQNCCTAVQALLRQTRATPAEVAAIGISYQMHGLVALDTEGKSVRPAIIWCDGRAVPIGDAAFRALGEAFCLKNYLNSPGNFTASKLRWVRENEPERFARIRKFMLPGDYIAYRLTGEMATTVSGLSEGILWNFPQNEAAVDLLEHYGLDGSLLPPLVPTFGEQGHLTSSAAALLGLNPGVPVTYRAGDQPNNALALNVLRPGDVAATGGTSGVVYGVVDRLVPDAQNRVNCFAHVNHRPEAPRIGVLLCINGCGIQYAWLRRLLGGEGLSYTEMERLAAAVPIGSDGLCVLPFGNGPERMLGNRDIGGQIHGLNFNRHSTAHLSRAALEGVAFAFAHGIGILRDLGLNLSVIRTGNDNLFQSAIFSETLANLTGAQIEVLATNGATGAAKAAGVGAGIFGSPEEAAGDSAAVVRYMPGREASACREAYSVWKGKLENSII
ncbi:MAG: FGGY family carbohydrate kinase [Saprospiraceae bacterium]